MHLKSAITAIAIALATSVAQCATSSESIARGVAALYGTLNAAGNWETVEQRDPYKPDENMLRTSGAQYTGRTALAVYALLSAGERVADPRLEKAIAFLKSSPSPRGTYALAFRCLAFSSMPQWPEIKKLAKRDAENLLAAVAPTGWSTYGQGIHHEPDASNSQITVLGLSAARDCGVEIPLRYWRQADKAWRDRQRPEGSWAYAPDDRENEMYRKPHPGMTAAGIATLLLIRDAVATGSSPKDKNDPNIDNAIAWLSTNFDSVFSFDFNGPRSLYALYALERVGVAGGLKRLGSQVWFERGSEFIRSRQSAQGVWVGGVDGAGDPTIDTAFALLFLTHADARVALNKLRYTAVNDDKESASWNLRSRDVARMTQWIQRQTEAICRWQIVDLATPADLDDAPVLYVTGELAPIFSDADVVSLKAYIDRGGLIVFSPENRAKTFIDAVRALGRKLYPGIEWRTLPDDHPLYTGQQFKAQQWKRKPTVQAMGNGTRELILLLNDVDSSRLWQAGASPASAEALELGANIVQYAGGPLPTRSGPVAVSPEPTARVSILHLQRKNEEPNAFPALVAALREKSIGLTVLTAPLGAALDPQIRLVHLPVDENTAIDDAQLKMLQAYTEAGGTVLLEAATGSEKSSAAIDTLMARGWPVATSTPLPAPLANVVRLRTGAMLIEGGGKPVTMRSSAKGRVIISRLDLSAGFAGLRSESIAGLTTESARQLFALLLN